MPAPTMPTATGGISLAETRLAAMLSICPAFQAWTETTTSETALTHIYFDSLPPPAGDDYTLVELTAYRPFARIWTDVERGYHRKFVTNEHHSWGGTLVIHFDADVPSTYTGYIAQALRAFKNSLGAIIQDLCDVSGGSGCLVLESLELIGPVASNEDEIATIGDSIGAMIRIEYQ